MINAIKINSMDNVITAIEHIKSGELIEYRDIDDSIKRLAVMDDIKIYHKIALADIVKDDYIIKYGEHIGVAKNNIKSGEHVHSHNTKERRENLEVKE